MDLWKYFDITHRRHIICNPMSVEKFDELIGLLILPSGARVLEIATGKGEFIIRLAEQYEIEGIGIDLSPYCVADAQEKHKKRIPEARLRFLEMDGAHYQPEEAEGFDLTACIGASWIYGGHRQTLEKMNEMAAPGAWVVVGEPYWRCEPAPAFLDAIGEKQSTYGTHHENAAIGQELGLELVYTLVSSQDDWDRYEGLQWYAAHAWAKGHGDDPDVKEVLSRVQENRQNYLKWGRDTFGWAIYVFRKDGFVG